MKLKYQGPASNSDLGAMLREMRKSTGLSQSELSKKTKLTQSSISRIEGGKHTPHMSVVAKLAAAMGYKTRLWVKDNS